jgi:ArsR family transcriptional regulator, virulence genes transcriptional regulator
MQTTQPPIENKIIIKHAATILRAINHPLRRQMVAFLREKGKTKVTDIFIHFRIEQPVASQHLAILRNSKIVSTAREGKFIFYSVNKERVSQIIRFSKDLVGVK